MQDMHVCVCVCVRVRVCICIYGVSLVNICFHWHTNDTISRVGANASAVDKEGDSALHMAAASGHADVIAELLLADASIDAVSSGDELGVCGKNKRIRLRVSWVSSGGYLSSKRIRSLLHQCAGIVISLPPPPSPNAPPPPPTLMALQLACVR